MKQLVKTLPPVYALVHQALSCYRRILGPHTFKKQVKVTSPLRIVIGASGIFDPGWIPTDIEFMNLLNPAHWERYFGTPCIDAILAEHVWEHLTPEDGLRAAQHCYRYLKPGAYVRAAVPDGFHPDPAYIDQVRTGGLGLGADDHKVLYNHETFRAVFEAAGFRVTLLEYFDAGGRFHCLDWDPGGGKIRRSRRFDLRNREASLRYTSVILDAYKNA